VGWHPAGAPVETTVKSASWANVTTACPVVTCAPGTHHTCPGAVTMTTEFPDVMDESLMVRLIAGLNGRRSVFPLREFSIATPKSATAASRLPASIVHGWSAVITTWPPWRSEPAGTVTVAVPP
jgi:hypothetical protein